MAGLLVRSCPGCGGSLGLIGQTLGSTSRGPALVAPVLQNGGLNVLRKSSFFGTVAAEALGAYCAAALTFPGVSFGLPETRWRYGSSMSVVAGAATADFQREGTNRKGSEKAPKHVDSKKLLHGKKIATPDGVKPGKQAQYSKATRRAYNEKFGPQADRLSKIMSAAGVASRRKCEEIIFEGRVTVNGEVVTVPQTQVHPRKDSIYVDGRSLPKNVESLYFCLNKPKGYMCSNDPNGKKLVVDLFEDFMSAWETKHPNMPRPRLFTVGRLDVATTGLLIVTNDGDYAQAVAHPSSGVTKEYIVQASEIPSKKQLQIMAEGTMVDGVMVVPLSVVPLDSGPPLEGKRILVEVADGRHHEVRELAKAADVEVVALKRTRIGGLRLPRDLLPGQYKLMSPRQIANVIDQSGGSKKKPPPAITSAKKSPKVSEERQVKEFV